MGCCCTEAFPARLFPNALVLCALCALLLLPALSLGLLLEPHCREGRIGALHLAQCLGKHLL